MSEFMLNQNAEDELIVIDTSEPVIFNQDQDSQPMSESMTSQTAEHTPGYREREVTDPVALLVIGAVAVVGIVPHFLHARHNRLRKQNSPEARI